MDQCDILLFVATQTELDELRAAALERGLSFDPISAPNDRRGAKNKSYWLGQLGSRRVITLKTGMGAIGARGSASLGLHYMQATQATSVICLGMAFGISSKLQSFGDVLISESLFPYDERVVIQTERGWEYEYDEKKSKSYPASPTMLKLLEAHRSKISAYKVFRGCLLSGNAVIRSVQYRDAILRWSQTVTKNVVGGQMEGAGLLALSPRNDPKWLVVKGISDFADEAQRESAEQHRQIACRNASNFVLDALLSEQSPNQSRGATHVH